MDMKTTSFVPAIADYLEAEHGVTRELLDELNPSEYVDLLEAIGRIAAIRTGHPYQTAQERYRAFVNEVEIWQSDRQGV